MLRSGVAERWVQERMDDNAPKETPRLLPAVAGEVPQPDRVPADGVVRLTFDEFVREKEQPGSDMREVEHAGEVDRECRSMRGVNGKNPA